MHPAEEEDMLQVLTNIAVTKGQQVLREFNDLVPTLRTLGLGFSDVSVKLGLPPEISATLTGSVEVLDRESIRELIDSHKENKTLTVILEALVTASNFKEQLTDLGFRGLALHVRLGMFPSVKLGLLPVPIPDTLSTGYTAVR
jgi:hypothetical protein